MNYPINIKFTKIEFEILDDRLTIGDCIAECFLDTTDDESLCPYTNEEIQASADKLSRSLGKIILENELDCMVLIDAVDGSTMPSKLKDEYDFEKLTASEYKKYKRAFNSITNKLKAVGLEAKFE